MEKAEKTMLDNLKKNTGKSLEQWVDIVRNKNFNKHGEIIKFLKENHSFTHGFANLVALKSRSSDSGSVADKNSLINDQYKGKEHFIPIYEKLIKEILVFGSDIEIAPKKAYVSLRRKKQFAILNPATKTRFEIGLNLKGKEEIGKLESVNTTNAMCSHVIKIASVNEINNDIVDWIKEAYDKAG